MERRGLLWLFFLALAGLGSVCAAEEPSLLRLDVPVTRELNPGDVHPYRLPLAAGDYAHVEIAQEGVDVATKVRSPSGAEVGEFDGFGSYSTDLVSFVADAFGDYELDVESPPASSGKRYRLILTAVRPATPDDRERVEAELADRKAMSFTIPEGLEQARRAVDLWHALGDSRAEAMSLVRLGAIQATSMPEESLANCTRALESLRSLGDMTGVADALNQIGKANRMLGHSQQAFAAHDEAIALWERSGQPDKLARALLDAGVTYEKFDETGTALAYYERALALSRQIGMRHLEASALSNLGQLHTVLGEPQQALEELRSALALAHTLATRRIENDVRNKLGNLYKNLGRLQDSIEQFASVEPKQCVARASLASVLFQLGSPDSARELLLEALPLCMESRTRALALVVLARAEEQLGLIRDAADHLDEALRLQRSVSDSEGEAETLRAQGILLLEAHEPVKARERLLESIALFDKRGNRSRAIAAHRVLARAEADLGHVDEARRVFEEALAQAKALDDVGEQALILAEAGRLEREAGNLQEALQRLDSALGLFESFRSEISGDRLRAQHFAAVRETYENYIDVLMQLDRSKADPAFVAKALVTAERSRARGLLDVLTRARIDTSDGNPELRDRELQLRQELSAKVEARFELPPGPRADALGQEIKALSAEQQIVEARLARESSYAELTQPLLTIPQIKALLDDNTALVEYLLAEPRSYVWIVTRESVTAHELPGRSQIEALARQAHEALSNPSERDGSGQRRTLALVSSQLLAPVLAGLDGKRLAIVADGALQYVPFAALPSSSAPASPLLIADHEIVMLPSVAVLGEIRRVEETRTKGPRSLAIFADPVYRGSQLEPLNPPQVLPATLRGSSLERLSWSRREAEQIAAEAEGHKVLKALSYDATRELALSEQLSEFRLIHFATHGFLDGDNPELSWLALSEVDKAGHPINGHLLLQDLYSLHLQADVVVLSACETGLGRDLRGEGFLGLTHGFLHAGASQVIATLWPVRDRAAAELMQLLYRAMLRDGMRPAAALRAAQLEMQSQRTWRDPYFWAAFIAQGDWLAGADTADTADTLPPR